MKHLLSNEQMKLVDQYSIETMMMPSLVLMERAALKVAECMKAKMCPGAKILAVAGIGNNGADAIAAGRILHNEGWDVAFVLVGNHTKQSEELKKQLDIIRIQEVPEYNINDIVFDDFDWMIDGIFGIGLSRPPADDIAKIIEKMNESRAKICAVDIPSGINGSGKMMGDVYVRGDMTVTFGYDKIGMAMYPGKEAAGKRYVEDIGFPRNAIDKVCPHVFAFEKGDIKDYLPKRTNQSNKGTYGKLLVIAGSPKMGGAAVLSSKAAYKTGAGLVRVLTANENREIILNCVPEVVLETYDSKYVPDVAWIKEQIDQASAIVVGPGLGQSETAKVLVKIVMEQKGKPVVADADALNILASDLEILKKHQCPLIVTPHPGEMSRLTGKTIEEIQKDLLGTCKDFALAYNLVCLLKDAATVISNGYEIFINDSGNNGMATAGSGDVLAGIIGGLLAQSAGSDAQIGLCNTAAVGAYIHGLAGDEAKKVNGVYGLLASDIIQYIAYILR